MRPNGLSLLCDERGKSSALTQCGCVATNSTLDVGLGPEEQVQRIGRLANWCPGLGTHGHQDQASDCDRTNFRLEQPVGWFGLWKRRQGVSLSAVGCETTAEGSERPPFQGYLGLPSNLEDNRVGVKGRCKLMPRRRWVLGRAPNGGGLRSSG